MIRWLGYSFVLTLLFASCNSKEKEADTDKDFFPALSFIQSQVTDVDSNIYSIMKIIKANGKADTTYIRKEEFKQLANDFLTMPDITSDKLKDDYVQSRVYDATLQRVVLSYEPTKKGLEIQHQDITIEPNEKGDKVKTIFINQVINQADSTVEKKMLWQVDKRFQIVTIIQKQNSPEQLQTLEVVWNDYPSAE